MEHFDRGSEVQDVRGRRGIGDGPAGGNEGKGRAEALPACRDEVSSGTATSRIGREAGREELVDAVEVGTEQGGKLGEACADAVGAIIAGRDGGELGEAWFLEEGFGVHSRVS